MRICSGLFTLLLLTGCQHADPAQSPATLPEAPSLSSNVLQNVDYAQVLEQPYTPADMRLSYGAAPLQFGDLWLPKTSERPAPLVIFVHGGCWLNQFDLKHSYPAASALQDLGYAVWSIEYRRTGDPGGGWPGSLEDIVQAIEYIQTQTTLPLDLSHITLAGHSAGGHLALLASHVLHSPVDKVIGLAPIVNIESYAKGDNSCQTATSKFMSGTPEERPERYSQANPVNFSFDKNVTLLAGEKDSIVPLPTNPLPEAQFISVPGAGHFDWVHPQTQAFSYFVDLLETN